MQPEYFIDRSLGRSITDSLRADGWRVHHICEVYPNDGQEVPDTEWIAQMGERGWGLLTKDNRIRHRAEELAAIITPLFCLANGQLRLAHQIDRFIAAQAAIDRAMTAGKPGFWKVYDDGHIKRIAP